MTQLEQQHQVAKLSPTLSKLALLLGATSAHKLGAVTRGHVFQLGEQDLKVEVIVHKAREHGGQHKKRLQAGN